MGDITAGQFKKWLNVFHIRSGGGGSGVDSWNGLTGAVTALINSTSTVTVAPSPRGNNAAPGVGTPFLPYATTGFAFSTLSSTRATTNPAVVALVPGTFTEFTNVPVLMKKNTSLIGNGRNISNLTLQGTGNVATTGFNTPGASNNLIAGVTITANAGMSFTSLTNTGGNVLNIEDTALLFGAFNIDSELVCTSNNSRYAAANIGTTGVSGATLYSDNDVYSGVLTVARGNVFLNNVRGNNVVLTAGAGDTSTITIKSSPGLTITATASGGGVATVYIDNTSYTGSNVTLVGDATVVFLSSTNPPSFFQSLLRTTDFTFETAPSTYSEFSWDTTAPGYVPGTLFVPDPGLENMPAGYQFTIGLVSDEVNPFTYALIQRGSSFNPFFAIYTGQRVLLTALPDGTGEGGFGYDVTTVYGGGHLQQTNNANFRVPPGYLALLEIIDGDVPMIITVNPICDFAALSYKAGQTLTILNNGTFNVLIDGQTVPILPGQYGMITCAQDIYGEGSFLPGVLTWSAA